MQACLVLRHAPACPPSQVQASVPYTKHLFLKPHTGDGDGEDGAPATRALFVAGLPLCVASDDLVQLFSVFGDVATLALHPSEVPSRCPLAPQIACTLCICSAVYLLGGT